jgi:hypothetical protein
MKIKPMKKENHVLFTILTVMCLILFWSCSDKLVVKQDFDFEIKNLPYKTTIKKGETVEIRYEIVPIEGSYSGTKYFMRYFQSVGDGFFQNENSEVFMMNDEYELSEKKFRLYFLPSTNGSHNLDITFYDSFRHEKNISIAVTVEDNTLE